MRKRYGRKVDANQKQISAALRAIGCNVFEIEEPFDLLIDYRRRWLVVECKNVGGKRNKAGAKGEFTKKQEDILETLSAEVIVARSPEEAIELVTKSYEGTEI